VVAIIAMAVFIENAAFHLRHQFPVGERPVRHGQTRVAAGDESTGDDQQQREEANRIDQR